MTEPCKPIDEVAAARALRQLDKLASAHPKLQGDGGPENVEAWIDILTSFEDEGEDMARKSQEATTQVAFRLPDTLLDRLDRHADRLSKENPGLTFTRVDAVRTLLTRALDELEGAEKRRSGKG